MNDLISRITAVNNAVNTFVWVTIGLVLLLGTGILMTVLTRFFQVTHFRHWMKHTIGSIFRKRVMGHTGEKGSISQFQALCTALAATVGVGNIAGTATAIVAGGPGAIFWMWVAAFFGMMTNYSENVLGIFYRRRDARGEWAGGAMYYLRDGLGAKKGCKGIGRFLGALFSVFCVLASFGIGNLSQVNTIVTNVTSVFRIRALEEIVLYTDSGTGVSVTLYMLIVGLLVMTVAALVIIGGIKRIASVTEKIVPFMVVLYILGAVAIVCAHYSSILPAFGAVFKYAFGIKAVAGGAAGIAMKEVVTWGFKRGVFSNEAGLGSSVMVHSASNVKEPVRQGMWGIFEVFADTMIICTLTALVVLTSGLVDLDTGAMLGTSDKVVLVSEAFSGVFGFAGAAFVAVAVFLFAFSTVLGWSYYGSRAWQYLFGEKSAMVYRVVFVGVIVLGSLLTSSLAWDISDTFNGLMMVPNLIGVVALSGTVMKITRNYVARHLKGRTDVEPMLSFDPDIQREQLERMREDGEREG